MPFASESPLMAWCRRLGQEPLATDRPTVPGFVENLPFREQAFDLVISAHVLKHSTDMVRFIAELQHVRYLRRTRIDYELLNPEADAAWTRPPADRRPTARLRQWVRDGLRGPLSLRRLRHGFAVRDGVPVMNDGQP
jgi:hypothetical protein